MWSKIKEILHDFPYFKTPKESAADVELPDDLISDESRPSLAVDPNAPVVIDNIEEMDAHTFKEVSEL